MRRMTDSARRGFTIIELAVTVTLIAAAGALAPAYLGMGQLGKARARARQLKDSTQARGIMQAQIIWAQNNQDRYVIPSLLDTADTTVAEQGPAKDTTANIFSSLIWNGFISTELCISPAEKNPAIKVFTKYQFNAPAKALKPADALWDPAFSADFTNGRAGHFSYAHLQPSGERLKRWSATFAASEVVLTNRGPQISRVEHDGENKATVTFANPATLTMKFYGGGKHWSGHATFNDNHVEYCRKKIWPGSSFTNKTAPHYTNDEGLKRLDTWCFEEPDDTKGGNNFLGIFTKAGASPKEFGAIWD